MNITPALDPVGRLDIGAITEIEAFCRELFESRCRCSDAMPACNVRIEIMIRAFDLELKGSLVNASMPTPILYDNSFGWLSGEVRGRRVSVDADGKRHFRAQIDSQLYERLPRSIVEEELGIEVQQKSSGGNSEPIPRAVWRHLADRYNLFDRTVKYEKH
ncbi:MAG: hypothetical protein MUO97_10180 [Dehalococcoidia bacterium]|nr:hypothetical protein [Dehalococcoidia bacterium]